VVLETIGVGAKLVEAYGEAYFEGRGSNYWWTVGSYQNFRRFPHWEEILKTVRSYRRSGRLLDIGCAYGLLVRAASKDFEAFGMDISSFALSKSRRFCDGNVSKACASSLPFKDEAFDVVTLIDTLEHVSRLNQCLEDIARILKRRGVLMLQLPNPLIWTQVCSHLGLGDDTHRSDLGMETWKGILRENGLIAKACYGMISYALGKAQFFVKSKRLLNLFPEWWIVAEKRSL